jgi:hypothetical protein
MPGRIGSRRATRILTVLGAASAIAVGVATPAGAAGSLGTTFSGAHGANGWFISPGVSATAAFQVYGRAARPLSSGEFDEYLRSTTCSGPGVTGGNFPNVGATSSPVLINFSVFGDSPSPAGVTVGCRATYERVVYTCFFFGCSSQLISPSAVVTNAATLKIDSSPPLNVVGRPVIPPAALNWHKVATVAKFSGQDPNSGIQTCSTNVPVSGPSSTLTKVAGGSCTNVAGLTMFGGYAYRFDNTPPSLAPTVSPNPVLRGATATASPHATDAHSGVASASCNTPDTSTIGLHTVACIARDVATNVATANAEYTVGYGFDGFRPPVDAHGDNVVTAGQAIPLKFRVFDSDGPVRDLAGVKLRAVTASCDLGVTDDLPAERATGRSGLRSLGRGRYRIVWKSPKSYANSCKTLKLDLGDHVAHTALFRFVKCCRRASVPPAASRPIHPDNPSSTRAGPRDAASDDAASRRPTHRDRQHRRAEVLRDGVH